MEPVPQSEATTTRATRAVLLLQAALVRLMSTAARSVGRYDRILRRANLAQYDVAPTSAHSRIGLASLGLYDSLCGFHTRTLDDCHAGLHWQV